MQISALNYAMSIPSWVKNAAIKVNPFCGNLIEVIDGYVVLVTWNALS